MKAEIKNLPKSEVQLTITVPYAVYKKWEKKALEDISKEIKVPGFRSGHMPEDVIRKNTNPEAIKAATLDYVLPQTYAEAVQKNSIQVIAQPQVDIKADIDKEGDDFVYVAKVAVMPEVKMGNYKKIKVKRQEVKVEPKNIQDAIKMIMERFAKWKDVDRKAQKNDRAEIEFAGFDEKGNAIPNTASKNHPVIIGSNTMVPGFEDAIIGMKKGEKKEAVVKFPKDYHAQEMQGKKVTFKITLNRLEEKEDQKLDDNMVEKITGKKQSVKEFEQLVEADLKAEMTARNNQDHDNKVVAEIMEMTKVDLPEILIDQELAMMLEEQKNRVKSQGIDWEQYLSHIKKTEEDFKKENRQPAKERVIARLGVQYILRDSKISVSEKDTQDKIEEMAKKYPKEQQKDIVDYYKDEKAFDALRNSLAADKLISMLSD